MDGRKEGSMRGRRGLCAEGGVYARTWPSSRPAPCTQARHGDKVPFLARAIDRLFICTSDILHMLYVLEALTQCIL